MKLKNKPVLFWSHGYRRNNRSLNSIIKEIYFNLFNGGFVYDRRAKRIFKEKGYNDLVDVVYNSLNYREQEVIYRDVLARESLFEKSKPYVVFSGRLTHTKKLNLIIEAISLLKTEGKVVSVVFIGDGPFKEQLIKSSESLGVRSQIMLMGSCYDEYIIANYFVNSMACVIPSAVGLSAIHALTYGTPVITNNNEDTHGPEIESVVDEFSGKLFMDNSVESLAVQIEYFLTITSARKEEYRKNALSIVRNKFNPSNQVRIFNDRINKLKLNEQSSF